LVVVITGTICAALLQLEHADLFPLWRLSLQWTPSALASTLAVPGIELERGLPTLSLTIAESDLRDPERGLLLHPRGTGPEWEREGSVSYFEHGRLLFASKVGVRLHGDVGATRPPGFRLSFRRRYGAREFAPGILFSRGAQPLRHLIVHNDVRVDDDGRHWHLVNPLAYDIARAMGAIAAETKPVRFFLNGTFTGVHVLTERFDKPYFAAHWGHDQIRGFDDFIADPTEIKKLWTWARRTRPMTMESVGREVDLDGLTRWFLAIAFSSTVDSYQWPGQFLDVTRKERRWFWVNWDMDRSFREWDLDMYALLFGRIEERSLEAQPTHLRGTIFVHHLLTDDPGYRTYFKRTFLRVMNHHVTDAFLQERYRHYRDVATELGVAHLDYLPRLRSFLERRPAFFRRLTEQWLNSPPSQPLTLDAPPGVSLTVDGEAAAGGYRGLYFPDLEIAVDIPAAHRTGFSGWRVNGQTVGATSRLTLMVDRPTHVEALFDQPHAGSTTPRAGPAARNAVAPRRPDVAWQRIPAGSFRMGCVPKDRNCEPDELPRREVRIAKPFEMMETEVAARDFQAFASASGRQMPRQPEWYADQAHPVVNLTWDEAQAYCEWVGGRLPTEAEWEYAARGGVGGRLFPWGDGFADEANAISTGDADRWKNTAPVGSLSPHGFGLHDMAGNVWEWTASQYLVAGDPTATKDGYDVRVIRGGSWDSSRMRLRSSERTGLSRQGRHNLYVGFRCVREP
jgi:formylglycine-generating enzyme required for sulfatase activity